MTRVAWPAGWLVAAAVSLSAQALVDQIVVRVNGTIITASDVRQARLLKLVRGDSDAAVRRALEDRVLMLAEAGRSKQPTQADLDAKRRAWEASAGAPAADLLKSAAMSSSALDDWLRSDLRIQAYIDERFGSLQEGDRERTIQRWIDGLRARADIR